MGRGYHGSELASWTRDVGWNCAYRWRRRSMLKGGTRWDQLTALLRTSALHTGGGWVGKGSARACNGKGRKTRAYALEKKPHQWTPKQRDQWGASHSWPMPLDSHSFQVRRASLLRTLEPWRIPVRLGLEALQSAAETAGRTISIIVTIIIGISHTACYLLLVLSSLERFCLWFFFSSRQNHLRQLPLLPVLCFCLLKESARDHERPFYWAQNSDKHICEYCNKERHYAAEIKALKELD